MSTICSGLLRWKSSAPGVSIGGDCLLFAYTEDLKDGKTRDLWILEPDAELSKMDEKFALAYENSLREAGLIIKETHDIAWVVLRRKSKFFRIEPGDTNPCAPVTEEQLRKIYPEAMRRYEKTHKMWKEKK